MKTIVTVILCSADYYTEYEIKSLLKILNEIIGMPIIKRNCIKADNYLKEGRYCKAAAEYVRIINSKEAAELTPEEYGDLFHNLAIAKVHITGLKEATKLFHQAYERNHREESLKQYLLTLRLCNREEEYLKKAEEYQIGAELDYSITDSLEKIKAEAAEVAMVQKIRELCDMKSQGKMSEFYTITDEIIETWKGKVRQG
jgi:tetratricopeptide (TPR) repeat protein